MIELCISAECKKGEARVDFKGQRGVAKSSGIGMIFKSDQVVKRLAYLSSKPKTIEINLSNIKGGISIEHLRFVRVTRGFALSRMLKKIAANDDAFRHMSVSEIKAWVRSEAVTTSTKYSDVVYALYNEVFVKKLKPTDYEDWIERQERSHNTNNPGNVPDCHLEFCPLISVILPTYNSDDKFLRPCIQSVLQQGYPHWELCVGDDASTMSSVRETLEEFAARDKRIKIVFRGNNGHISAASNSAMAIAKGDYYAFLDHDDMLAPDALLWVVEALNRRRDAKVIYSDEDKIDSRSKRSNPYFKPDWNPDLFYAQNYLCHLTVIDADLVDEVGGFRSGVEGSQDYDLLLRCIARIDHTQIVHIPKVLYHWRMTQGSTALAPEEKSYTTDAGLRALRDLVIEERNGISIIQGSLPNTYRVTYPILKPEPLVSLLIPTRDRLDVLQKCVDSILDKTSYRNFELIVLDNGSVELETLDYLHRLRSHKMVRVEAYDKPFNYSALNNYGVSLSSGELIGLINNDIEVISPEWLTEMVSHAVRSSIGCVGAKLYYPNDQIQHAGVILGIGGVAGHAHKYFDKEDVGYFGRLHLVQNYSALTGACLLVRKSIYEQVGGLNERDLPVAFNDVDFCLKVREAGYRNVWTPYAELYHHESISRGNDETADQRNRAQAEIEYMKQKWGDHLYRDPAYNPNLTLIREDFSLA
jgi:GT2 family glycosyltransferase